MRLSPRGRVNVIVGNKAREIAELQAPTADAAIKRAIAEFGISDPHKQARLAARSVPYRCFSVGSHGLSHPGSPARKKVT